ncbi:ABC transporter substrate-binding protein [Brachybacterium kimchii]|uniref:ABC transporter substrate-binding protein n=1 Tax=Brachybacterium kimchii TaxID=2942909 RepID=A0ABY4N1V4_9MICO|nr:ABC transporter substrate-binding protein [Brachybacterium kimchii]UQN28096.1 ABC transporter substrate-binding protein [Brachybacterium kimchii]
MLPPLRAARLRRAGAMLAIAAVALTGCVQPGRTVHPDSDVVSEPCPVDPDPSITTTARIAWQPIPNGDLVVKDRRILENCMPNADISWVQMNSGGDVLQAFGSRSVDLAQVGSSPAVKGRSAPLDVDLQIVWLHDVIGTAESLVVRDSSIKDLKGLGGKRIAVPFGSTSHFSLLNALQKAGMSGKVQIVNLSTDAMQAAWQRGEIDAAWVWEPTLGDLAADGTVIMSSADTAKTGAATYDLEAGTRDFINKNPEFMKMWGIAQGRGVEMMREDKEAASDSLAAQLGTPRKDALKLMKGYEYLTPAQQLSDKHYGKTLPEVLAATADFLLEQKEIDAEATPQQYAGMLYPDALEAAR